MSLTIQQEAFVAAYAVTMSALRAAELAGYEAPRVTGPRLIANVAIRKAVQKRLEKARKRAGLPTDQELLLRLHQAAWADPNELVAQVVRCCRHCHGIANAYQWRDEVEWATAVEKAIEEHEARLKRWKGDEQPPKLALPDNAGGYGFDPHLLPAEECRHCNGDGKSITIVKDTRFLSPGARWLYAGVKQTKDGIQVLMHDQLKMRELELRHRGLLNDKLIHITPGGAGALGIAQEELAALSPEDLEALENAQLKILAVREQKALPRPDVVGEITDVE